MTILDRYITRQFLSNALLLMAFLMAMIVGVDFSLNFDEFVKQAKAWIAAGAAPGRAEAAVRDASGLRIGALALWALMDLWWPRLFLMFGYLLGPVLVGALGFTCAYLVKQRELVAIIASGQSLWRVARPMLLCCLGLVLLHAINREFVIPELAPRLTRDVKQRDAKSLRDFTTDAQGRLLYFREIKVDASSPNQGEVRGLFAWDRDADGLITRRTTAQQATWGEDAWILRDGLATPRAALSNAGPGTRLLPTPVDRLATDVGPTALKLRRYEGMASNLSTRQLTDLITQAKQQEQTAATQRRIDGYNRIRWGRVSTMLATLMGVVVCLPFFLRKEPANMLTQSLAAAPIALGTFAGTLLGTTASIPGLPAGLAAFVPVIVMVPLLVAAASSVRS